MEKVGEEEVGFLEKVFRVESGARSVSQLERMAGICKRMEFWSCLLSKLSAEEGDEEKLLSFLQSATLERAARGTAVFLEGDASNNKCYVVLSGKVGIYRSKVHCLFKIPSLKEIPSVEETPIYRIKESECLDQQTGDRRKLTTYGNLIVALGQGSMFGEAAVMTSKCRNATALCTKDCVFMVIHKHSLESLKYSYTKEFSEKKAFLIKMIPEIGLIRQELRVAQLAEYFKPIQIQNGCKLTLAGSSGKKIFFIKEGELQLSSLVSFKREDNSTFTRECNISTVPAPCIVGEESLESPHIYKYTATVRSAFITGYLFEPSPNLVDFASFPLYSILFKGFKIKEKCRKLIIASIREREKRLGNLQEPRNVSVNVFFNPRIDQYKKKLETPNSLLIDNSVTEQIQRTDKIPSGVLDSPTTFSNRRKDPKQHQTDLSSHLLRKVKTLNFLVTSQKHYLAQNFKKPLKSQQRPCPLQLSSPLRKDPSQSSLLSSPDSIFLTTSPCKVCEPQFTTAQQPSLTRVNRIASRRFFTFQPRQINPDQASPGKSIPATAASSAKKNEAEKVRDSGVVM